MIFHMFFDKVRKRDRLKQPEKQHAGEGFEPSGVVYSLGITEAGDEAT